MAQRQERNSSANVATRYPVIHADTASIAEQLPLLAR